MVQILFGILFDRRLEADNVIRPVGGIETQSRRDTETELAVRGLLKRHLKIRDVDGMCLPVAPTYQSVRMYLFCVSLCLDCSCLSPLFTPSTHAPQLYKFEAQSIISPAMSAGHGFLGLITHAFVVE